ncbi:hypothetical protein Pint_20906 [Pistacia integerrima]|uniref:Uncharacterized protein n=1 Tax=Pistacia integerrima TaxID=434235 RepID=A0ACC0XC96_9ROSI|nr:hypothetical protein Pint_20906 [Pistacia integerrima]
MQTWFIILFSISIAFLLKAFTNLLFPNKYLPPGPPTFPIIGNLLWLRRSTSQIEPILRNLHAKFGSIVTLHFGSRPAIFVADCSLAYKALVQNGAVFSNRPPAPPTTKLFSSNQQNITSSSYGPTWRLLRRNLNREILHPARVRSYTRARKWVLHILLDRLKSESKNGDPVRVMDHFQYGIMSIALNDGFKIPIVGLGVWRMEGKEIRDLIIHAIKIGYRHFDCAGNFSFVLITKMKQKLGRRSRKHSRLDLLRGRIFSSPPRLLWNSDHGHVVEACRDSLKKLQLDYLDLYLVHFPLATKHTGVGETDSALDEDGVLEIDTTISLETTWHNMENLVSMGLVRSIGISNYDIFLTRDCLAYAKLKPAVNQIETHPYFQRDSLVKFCQKHGICVTAHTPLGGAVANTEWFGTVSCLGDPVLKGLAEKYKKTVAQIVLKWGMQRNTVVIPKSSKLERLKGNFEVFDFELSKEDMDVIKSLDRKYRTNQPAKFWGIDVYA